MAAIDMVIVWLCGFWSGSAFFFFFYYRRDNTL